MKNKKKIFACLFVLVVGCLLSAQLMAASVVLYAPFENSATTVFVGTNLDPWQCTFQNAQAPVAGVDIVTHAALFNGSRYVKVPDNPILDLGIHDFAIAFWVKTTSTKGNNTVLDKRARSFAPGYHVTLYQGYPLLRMADNQGNGFNYCGNKKVNDGDWHHVLISVDRDATDGGKIYVDGEFEYTFNPTRHAGKSLDNNVALYIGKHTDWSHAHFVGTLDELRIYRTALTQQKVSSIKR